MKWKAAAVIVALLLVGAQIIFGGKKAEDAPARAERTAQAVEAAQAGEDAEPEPAAQADAVDAAEPGAPVVADVPAAPAEPAAPALPAFPSPDEVTGIVAGAEEGGGALKLTRTADGWAVANRGDFPADAERIDAFLAGLLASERVPVPADSGEIGEAGLENDGDGLPVALTLRNGNVFNLRLGRRPAGVYDAAFIRLPDGGDGVVLRVGADVRGDLGLWRNRASALPGPSDWIRKTVLSFNPEDAARIEAAYPDHRIVFGKSPEGEWRAEGYVPGGEWDRDGFAAWLAALADFRIADVVDAADISPEEFPESDSGATHRIDISLAGGESLSVRVRPDHGGEGMLAATSAFPGRVFRLPEWRFREYFHVLSSLFPRAAPHFELARVRFIDILQGGEKVKIARRDDGWLALALPYAVRSERADRLARLLSSWRPEEYASPDFKAVRPNYGAPMVEVTLDDGVVRQYRLGGRHPLFPWRYVALDGREIFSVTDSGAAAMFPEFAGILDLGRVFRKVAAEDVDRAEFAVGTGAAGTEVTEFVLVRNGDGKWAVSGPGPELELSADEARELVEEPLAWRVAGLYGAGGQAAESSAPQRSRLRLSGLGGLDQAVVILQSTDRDIPYRDPADDTRGYRIDRADFQNWLAATRSLEKRIKAAVAEAAEKTEVEGTEEVESAVESVEAAAAEMPDAGE